ncbi:MAG: hypothetical protein DHS20C17_14510 [Cyclobacteriaceae bacterium]|nr:MAG: hypothetical protein DHS20C17_14510 [Cyclobacteriaceae bacterium]
MKLYKFSVSSFTIPVILLLFSCSSDDQPVPVNEEEVITTMAINLVPQPGGTTISLETRDLDADGPNPPVVSVSGAFEANTVYSGSIALFNETVSPAEDLTGEVAAEGDEHQFFFQGNGTVNITTTYEDQDSNGNPIGLSITMTTGEPGSGVLTVVLRHLPDKNAAGVGDGDISNAGGETDISVAFPVEIQ